jgi:CDP-diacylglycerol---serine O-phosphatidyltransferase
MKLRIVIKHIPNTITAGNLFLGCLSIVATFDGNLTEASYFILAAALLDFFDGFAARILNVHSEIGKQLDSLADVVSFGVAPGFIFYSISQEHLVFEYSFLQFVPLMVLISYLPFLIPVFSAVRLAKFNIDERQSDSFIGVPTPANSMFICSVALVMDSGPFYAQEIFTSVGFLSLFPILSAWLLVAELPLFALKFKQFSWKGNEIRYLFLLACLLLLLTFQYFGIGLSIILYVLLSLFTHLKK